MLKLSKIFQNNTVLQRRKTINIWGWSKPWCLISATLNKVEITTLSGDDGKFILNFPPQEAKNSVTLEVINSETNESIKISNIAIGEVYLASGQSNMEWSFDMLKGSQLVANTKIRQFSVPRNAWLVDSNDFSHGEWQEGSLENLSNFSCVGFYFADKLQRELGDIIVGIINSSWGGSPVESWISEQKLKSNPVTSALINTIIAKSNTKVYWSQVKEALGDFKNSYSWEYLEQLSFRNSDMPKEYPLNKGELNSWHKSDFDDSSWQKIDALRNWQDNPELDFNGVVWYRRTFAIPQNWCNKNLRLHIGGIDKHDVTYVNGQKVGTTGKNLETTHWDKPRNYLIPAILTATTKIKIAIRVYSFIYGGGISGESENFFLCCEDSSEGKVYLDGKWSVNVELNMGKTTPPEFPNILVGHGNPFSPSVLFRSMIYPLLPYSLAGIIWY